MGKDLFLYAEVRSGDTWTSASPLTGPMYGGAGEFRPIELPTGGWQGLLDDWTRPSKDQRAAFLRGLPTDLSQSVRAAYEDTAADACGESWLTFDELLTFTQVGQVVEGTEVVDDAYPDGHRGRALFLEAFMDAELSWPRELPDEPGSMQHPTVIKTRHYVHDENWERAAGLLAAWSKGKPSQTRVVMWFA